MKSFKSVLLLTALTLGLLGTVPAISHADMGMGNMGMANEKAETAIDGFCPVCVIKGMAVKGSDNFVTVYKGKLYKFAGFDQQKMFIEDPETYTQDLEAKLTQLQNK